MIIWDRSPIMNGESINWKYLKIIVNKENKNTEEWNDKEGSDNYFK